MSTAGSNHGRAPGSQLTGRVFSAVFGSGLLALSQQHFVQQSLCRYAVPVRPCPRACLPGFFWPLVANVDVLHEAIELDAALVWLDEGIGCERGLGGVDGGVFTRRRGGCMGL